jgi:DNA-binding response OmpR family regulator
MSNTQPSLSILVVEDDEHISQVLRFMLERQGYHVVHLADGRAAASHVGSAAAVPALVLLDVMLPYVDGFEIVRLIRARADWASVPVLMLTAKNTERDTVRALDAGASDFVIKPFQPNELLARVRRYVRVAA